MYSKDTIFFYNTCGFTDIMNLTIMRIQETARKTIAKDLEKMAIPRCSELEKRKNGSAISLLLLSAFSSAGTNRKIAVRNN